MDKDEFLSLALDSEQTLFHVSFSILHNEQDCADAVQEALLKAYENRHKLREKKYFKTWIVRIAINECYSLLRKTKRCQAYDELNNVAGDSLADFVKEEYIDLYQAVSRLPEKEKICVILFLHGGVFCCRNSQGLKNSGGNRKEQIKSCEKRVEEFID